MGRSFRLRAGSFVALAAVAVVVVGGCSSKREVLATDRQDELDDPGFVGDVDAGAPPPLSPDASTIGLCATNECPAGRTTCPNSPFPCAVDLLSDDDNCGACGRHCPSDTPYITAYGGFTKCVDGACQRICLTNTADCNGLPEDGCETNIGNDKHHCGGCGVECDDICVAGVCGCPSGETYCPASNSCRNLRYGDNQNCGTCGNICSAVGLPALPVAWRATRTCGDGECNQLACQAGYLDCNTDLGDPDGDGCEIQWTNDPQNCGGCGNRCDAGQSCVSGKCLCPPGTVLCGTSLCVQLESDVGHCGVCNYQCPGDGRSLSVIGVGQDPDPAHGRPVCEQGTCDYRCSPNWGDCDKSIGNGCETSLLDDPLNCGACGVRCNAVEGQACVNGQCLTKPCEVR